MPNAEQAAIWNSPAGGSLMGAMLGLHEPTDGDRETMARLKAAAGAEEDDGDDAPAEAA